MNRLTLLLMGCVLLGVSTFSAAVDSRGSRSCASWEERRLQQQKGHPLNSEIEQTWLVGYLSGLVAGSGMDFLIGTDNETVFAMVDQYCQLNPHGQLAAAGTSIARELMATKGIVNVPTLP